MSDDLFEKCLEEVEHLFFSSGKEFYQTRHMPLFDEVDNELQERGSDLTHAIFGDSRISYFKAYKMLLPHIENDVIHEHIESQIDDICRRYTVQKVEVYKGRRFYENSYDHELVLLEQEQAEERRQRQAASETKRYKNMFKGMGRLGAAIVQQAEINYRAEYYEKSELSGLF